ncbi:MAG: adenylyltransferase/cytidyltransferase family protein [Solobacterium sp.]|nr:adenylyltransferase/cytidyltransferase family protein [Solobacterium sp.]
MEHYRVGLLMGVFDLFHTGHLKLIRNAGEHCEYLRVAILSDELVMKFKHHYPVIPEEERKAVLEAVKGVDEVVIIEDNPSRIMEWHRRPFDCFFSGNDYENNDYWKWEKEELRKLGADLLFFPYTEEQSTTKIIQRIQSGSYLENGNPRNDHITEEK